MSDPANPSADPARLDDLAEVTREYARYSRTAYGMAFVATGVAVLATVALDLSMRSEWIRFAYPLLPALWLLLLASSRAYYQRHGQVVEPHQRVGGRGWLLAYVYLLCAAKLAYLAGPGFGWARASGAFAGPRALMPLIVVLALVAVPVLTAEIVRGKADMGFTLALVGVGCLLWETPRTLAGSAVENLDEAISVLRVVLLVLVSVGAIAAIFGGARDHMRYRALERRFAALRARA